MSNVLTAACAAALVAQLAACGAVKDDPVVPPPPEPEPEVVDASVDAPVDAAPSSPLTGRDCNAIHTAHADAPSGTYTIDPDGPGGRDPFVAPCDMKSRGGGWTIIFLASGGDYVSKELDYTAATPALLDTVKETMVAFRHADLAPYTNDAVFAFPAEWKKSPLTEPSKDIDVKVSVDGAVPVNSTLKFGYSSFHTKCLEGWEAGNWGRICFQGTKAPYYSGFNNMHPTATDWCTDSESEFNTGTCNGDVRFSIAVR